MKAILLLLFFLGSTSSSFGQTFSEQLSACDCTVERISGNRKLGRLKITIASPSLQNVSFGLNSASLPLKDSLSYLLYRTFTFKRELDYPYLYLTHQQQSYTLDLQAERLYAGLIIIGVAKNATEAFELLITQVLLPQQCSRARVAFSNMRDEDVQIQLLPGSFYN